MIDFVEYVVSELKSKRLSKADALALIKQFSLRSSAGSQVFNIHPLLHVNTSNLGQQSYSTVLTGEEFFLKDHQINDQKILPAVAYLEMARAAVEEAIPFKPESTILELHNVVWSQPIVVKDQKEINVALFSDSADINSIEKIDFEIYSTDSEIETTHCQGQAILIQKSALSAINIVQLKEQMTIGKLDASDVYPVFRKMGAKFGPAHQGIKTIFQGDKQVVAALCLPSAVETSQNEYLLHPSLMDSSLQSSIGLYGDINKLDPQPSLPFALDILRVISPCKKEMFAWVRYSQGSQPGDRLEKLDVDLCDQEGNICVQMKGYSSRVLANNINTEKVHDRQFGTIMATPIWQPTEGVTSEENSLIIVQHHIFLDELSNVVAAQLESSLSNSKCHQFQITRQENVSDRFSNYALVCFEKIKSIIKDKPLGKVLVQFVIANNQNETLLVGLSGLLKTAALENPQITGQIILVVPNISSQELVSHLQADKTRYQDKIIKYENDTRNVLRFQEVPVSKEAPKIVFKDQGVYLITGGLGGLGILFAKEIINQTSKATIILAEWSELTSDKKIVLESLSTKNNLVLYRQLDIANLDQVKQLVISIEKEYNQLNGIIHCAGLNLDNFILKKTTEEFSKVLMPKVNGTFNLDQACQNIDLDFFVLFSSVASSFGNIGQADYASANGFMNQFAIYRNNLMLAKQRYGKTLAINWPLWLEGGMSPDKATQELLQQTTGMYPMKTVTGMDAFYKGLELPYGQILVMEGDLQQLRALLEEPTIELESPVTIKEEQVVVTKKINTEINAASLVEKTQDLLRKQFSVVLKLPPHKIDVQEPLEKYGIDSILAMSLTNQLEKTFGSLPKTLFFEFQTLHELTEYFIKSFTDTLNGLFTKTEDNQQSQSKPVEVKLESTTLNQVNLRSSRQVKRQRSAPISALTSTDSIYSDPIAIVGLSGRYPESVDIEEYWKNLRDGKDCITEIPESRWDWHEYYSENRDNSGHHFSKWGGFISGVDEFDPRFFNISPREAVFVDPQERLFLQHAWMAIEDAGYTRTSLQIPHEQDLAGQVGVYVGVMYSEYQLFGAEASMRGKRMSIPGSYASIANRVSYVLNLHGPSMTLDTMCSSSLVAIQLACQDLKLGRTKLAIAGGVNVTIHPNKYLFLSDGQFISTDGHCQSFGEGGDGYIPGEGVGAVILKRLSDAIQDGNHIYGIIKGIALNHGGKTNGYSVPNPQAQTSVINRALAESKTNPRHISYIEAHGTGTKLGDPIEIAAISKAFQQHTQDNEFCFIGSNKSNIGHCESAAGISALTKVLLQMKYRKIVPSLHSKTLNPYIDFQKTPFIVNQTLREWEQPVIDGQKIPRIAGISAFGAGGSNAHVIVQEYVSPAKPIIIADQFSEIIIPLSAKTADQLKQKAYDLLKFITSDEQNGQFKDQALELNKRDHLVSMAYTLQVGREAMEERVGFIVNTTEHLAEKLHAYINGETDVENMYQGQIKSNKGLLSSISSDTDFDDTLNKWLISKKLSKVLEFWVNGLDLDWNKLYGDVKPPYISLPTYPFAKERYWIDLPKNEQLVASIKPISALHPLLHTNTSDLSQQSYSSTFSGQEFFLKDHQINTINDSRQKMFPALAFLEMARAAIEQVSPIQQKSIILELHNLAWGQPAVVSENKQITIALFADDTGDNSIKQFDYEIYSQENGAEIVHCIGQAVFNDQPTTVRLDIERIIKQIGQDRSDAKNLYIVLNNMGFNYGPTFQCLKAVYQGNDVLLAELSLPSSVENVQSEYILHPSIMNSALQASIGLIMNKMLNHPFLPIALESLCIYSACTNDMFALIRYSPQVKQPEDKFIKLDIDLCDQQGNICVQMRGLSLQQLIFNLDNQTKTKMTSAENAFIVSQTISIKPQSIQLNGLNDLNSVTGIKVDTDKPQSIQLINS